MKKVMIVLVLAGVLVALKMRNQGSDSDQVLSDMRSVIAEMDEYQANSDYLDRILEARHPKAFRDAYDMGRRRRRATFNDEQYVEDVLTRMVKDCNNDKKQELAVALAELRDLLLKEMADTTNDGS